MRVVGAATKGSSFRARPSIFSAKGSRIGDENEEGFEFLLRGFRLETREGFEKTDRAVRPGGMRGPGVSPPEKEFEREERF